ncbi:MAG: RNA 2',3'-cyclic phosphodiesterase [Chloroflexota bacterium]
METIRAFIAVELPVAVKQELGLAADVLAGLVPPRSVRWVKPDLIHVTLCFLGETAVAKLPAIQQTLDETAQKHAPLTLRLNGTGCFPNARRPQVIWVGLAGDLAALAALKADLDDGLASLGWEKEERPFQPHLTLGRVNKGQKLAGFAAMAAVKEIAFPVTAVLLIESQLTRQGPVYTVRHVGKMRDT